MIIRVLRRHILKGRRGMMRSCPIALAIKEQVGEKVFVKSGTGVDGYSIATADDSFFDLPRVAKMFVSVFDSDEQNRKFIPTFSFSVPGLEKIKKALKKKANGKKRT